MRKHSIKCFKGLQWKLLYQLWKRYIFNELEFIDDELLHTVLAVTRGAIEKLYFHELWKQNNHLAVLNTISFYTNQYRPLEQLTFYSKLNYNSVVWSLEKSTGIIVSWSAGYLKSAKNKNVWIRWKFTFEGRWGWEVRL